MLKILLLFSILLAGCEQMPAETSQEIQPSTPAIAAPKQQEPPTNVILVETPAEAIPLWRQHTELKPALVIFSQNPFLLPIPEPGRQAALELARTGTVADFQQRANSQTPDPLIHPDMSLSLALDAELFSEIIWVLPQQSSEIPLPLEILKEKLLSTGTATNTEAESFKLLEQRISGRLRQIPLTMISQHHLAPLETPYLVHIDLSFFKSLYRNEIKTPLYPQVYQIMNQISPVTGEALSVSISLGNKTGEVSLQVRFFGDLLVRLLSAPELLKKPLAANDARRNQAMQLANFFKKEQRLKLYLEMASEAPQDAAVKYDLFQISAEFNQGEDALAYLAEAVALDPIYAQEYLQLAEQALEKNRPDAALQMLDFATAAIPENPFIDIRKGEILLENGHPELTENILFNLLQLPWSELYYPGIRNTLRQKFAADAL